MTATPQEATLTGPRSYELTRLPAADGYQPAKDAMAGVGGRMVPAVIAAGRRDRLAPHNRNGHAMVGKRPIE